MALGGLRLVSEEFCPPLEFPALFASTRLWVVFCLPAITGRSQGDFGVKYNISNGGPAPEKVTEAIYARSKVIDNYQILDAPDVDLEILSESCLGDMVVEVIDVQDYEKLMESLFDFDRIHKLLTSEISGCAWIQCRGNRSLCSCPAQAVWAHQRDL